MLSTKLRKMLCKLKCSCQIQFQLLLTRVFSFCFVFLYTLNKIILKISQLQPRIVTFYECWLHERPERSKDIWLWRYANRMHTFYFTRFTRINCCGLCRVDYNHCIIVEKKTWEEGGWSWEELLINTRKMTTRSSRMQALIFMLYYRKVGVW